MKLISMTDFVLEKQKKRMKPILKLFYIENYAQFLKQPLTLGMFVPCDDDGNVLEEPIETIGGVELYEKRYSEAQSKVIFNNFRTERYPDKKFENISATLRYKDCYVGIIHKDSDKMKLNDTCSKETIEDLICFNLDLAVSF